MIGYLVWISLLPTEVEPRVSVTAYDDMALCEHMLVRANQDSIRNHALKPKTAPKKLQGFCTSKAGVSDMRMGTTAELSRPLYEEHAR
jgi:hypothetical protein